MISYTTAVQINCVNNYTCLLFRNTYRGNVKKCQTSGSWPTNALDCIKLRRLKSTFINILKDKRTKTFRKTNEQRNKIKNPQHYS